MRLSRPTALLPLLILAACTSAPPNIAFVRGAENDDGDEIQNLWRMATDGSGAHALTSSTTADHHSPIPFGSSCLTLFASWKDTGPPLKANQLYSIDACTGAVLRLTSNAFDDLSADYHRGTGRLVIGRDLLAGNLSDLYIVESDGSEAAVVAGPEDTYEPRWSPDGKSIAYTRKAGASTEIWIWDSATGQSRAVIASGNQEREPAWSPDGTQIAYSRWSADNFEIFVSAADGSGVPQKLTDDPAYDGMPSWGPDGTRILFSSDRGGDFDIWAMNPTGSSLIRLTDTPENDYQPVWSE